MVAKRAYNGLDVDPHLVSEVTYEFVEDFTPERVPIGRSEVERVVAALNQLSQRTRDIYLLFRLENMKQARIAELFGIGEASVSRWLRLERETRDVEPEPHGGGFPPRIAESQYGTLRALVAEKPDRTVVELCAEWERRHGTNLSRSAMQRALLKAGFTWKKNGFVRLSKIARTSGISARRT
jgi:transposase